MLVGTRSRPARLPNWKSPLTPPVRKRPFPWSRISSTVCARKLVKQPNAEPATMLPVARAGGQAFVRGHSSFVIRPLPPSPVPCLLQKGTTEGAAHAEWICYGNSGLRWIIREISHPRFSTASSFASWRLGVRRWAAKWGSQAASRHARTTSSHKASTSGFRFCCSGCARSHSIDARTPSRKGVRH